MAATKRRQRRAGADVAIDADECAIAIGDVLSPAF
jgi:hypothetical protein